MQVVIGMLSRYGGMALFAALGGVVACPAGTASDGPTGDPPRGGDIASSGDTAAPGDTSTPGDPATHGDAAAGDTALPGDAATPGDSATHGDGGPTDPCDPFTTGLVAPLPECSPARPCYRASAPFTPVTVPSEDPGCDDNRWDQTLTQVIDGTTRFACIARPTGANSTSQRPLVLFFHGGGEGAADAQSFTTLLTGHETADLTGATAPTRLGYTLVSVHGRRIFFPTSGERNGEYHHDFYYRDLNVPSTNPDIANVDAWVDTVVAEGIVDPDRIYLMGWSNGAFFSQMYAIARHQTPTPGGSRVAAAAVFAAADPFHDIERDPFTNQLRAGGSSCQLQTYPTSTVPILLTYKTCDLTVSCGPTGVSCFDPNPGFVIPDWLTESQARGITGITGAMLNGIETGQVQNSDASTCTDLTATCNSENCADAPTGAWCMCLVNHLRWPNGSDPGGGSNREPGMFLHLRANPLPP